MGAVKVAHLKNHTNSQVLAQEVEEAKGFFSRLRGLLGRNAMTPSTALWLEPCDSIHTFFMRFSIDAIFVDRNLVVRKVVRNIKPWRLVTPVSMAHSVFELSAGATAEKVREGDQLHVGS